MAIAGQQIYVEFYRKSQQQIDLVKILPENVKMANCLLHRL